VRDWAMQAADQVAAEWQMTSTHLELLDWTCQLHELGLVIAHDRHQLHGAYVVRHADMPGFSRQEQEFMAALLASQRQRLDQDIVQRQPVRLQAPLCHLIAILRLAVTICRSRLDSDVPDFALEAADWNLVLRLPDGWLEAHPLSARGLSYQQRQLEKLGVNLEIGVLSSDEQLDP
jgi:exopolyphosphatase / guanosine-5'-triphosphate,3'-diphosphate pyrophosphatase